MPAPARNINNELTGQIIDTICEVWGISRPDLVGRCRRRPLPWAREQLCNYLRRYAGHDMVSCAAILHISPQTIGGYDRLYISIRRTYIQFRDRDDEVQRRLKAIGCKPVKKQ